jgi:hypothetical protein
MDCKPRYPEAIDVAGIGLSLFGGDHSRILILVQGWGMPRRDIESNL